MDHKCSFCDYSSDKAYNLKRHTTRQHKGHQADEVATAEPVTETIDAPSPDIAPTDTSTDAPSPDIAPAAAPPAKTKGGRKPAQKKSDTKQATVPTPAPTPPPNNTTSPDKNEEDDDDDGPYDYRDAKTGERLMVLTIDDFNDLYHSIVSSVVDALYAKGMLTRHPFQKSDPKNEEQKM